MTARRLGGAARSRYSVIVAAAVLGSLLTMAAFLLVCWWEYRVAEIDFESRAKSYLEVVNGELGDARNFLYTIATFIASDERPITERQFVHFSASLHRRVPGLRDASWAPYITLAQRPAFERAARASGLAGYHILEFGPHHTLVVAGLRPAYYPLLYVENGHVKNPPWGLDLSSDKTRVTAMMRAIRTGAPAATPPMDVLTVNGRGAGILGYMPVFQSFVRTAGQRQHPSGVVLGVFDLPAMFNEIIALNHPLTELNLSLFNPRELLDHRLIYRTVSAAAQNASTVPSEKVQLAGAHLRGSVVVIDQHLDAIVTPGQPLRVLRFSLFSTTTLVLGLTMTAMIVAYLLQALRRTLQLELLTSSLEATTITLSEKAAEISLLSRLDELTGLPNRLRFLEGMNEAAARCARGAPFALLFLDLDRFKAVNDTLGHGAGDRLLRAVSERIAACLRDVDMAARLGGDEFAVILADGADAEEIAIVALRLINSVSRPYQIDDQQVAIGVSIGGAIARPGVAVDALIAEADLAMYEAKAAGRGVFRIFDERLRAKTDEKRQIEQDLRDAFEREELEVYYAPIVNVPEARVVAFLALPRWHHPLRGAIASEEFLAAAQECGLIDRLGLFVLRTACDDAARWPQPVNVVVHASPFALHDETLPAQVFDALTAAGLAPERLEFEVTRAAVQEDQAKTIALIEQLRERGIRISFNDFGTGYSSLKSLIDFPFDKMILKGAFVRSVGMSARADALVRAVIGLATNLGLTTRGEGVETLAHLEQLRRCGCTEAKGYFFGRPGPTADVPAMLRSIDERGKNAFDPVAVTV